MNQSRFALAVDTDAIACAHVNIVGCGCLGSYTALALMKMGIRHFTLIDHDTVSEANLCTQLFPQSSVGELKVTALQKVLFAQAPDPSVLDLELEDVWFCGMRGSTNVVISALDNMVARRVVRASSVMREDLGKALLHVDPRMAFTTLDIQAIMYGEPDCARAGYEACLADPAQEYADEVCGARAIAGTGMFCAGLVQWIVARYLSRRKFPHRMMGDLDGQLTSYHRKVWGKEWRE